jgi:hypothetical protein
LPQDRQIAIKKHKNPARDNCKCPQFSPVAGVLKKNMYLLCAYGATAFGDLAGIVHQVQEAGRIEPKQLCTFMHSQQTAPICGDHFTLVHTFPPGPEYRESEMACISPIMGSRLSSYTFFSFFCRF